MAFRGVGKTWIYAAFVCSRLNCDPGWTIMVVSATKPFADDFTTLVKRLINEMPLLIHLKPRKDQRDSNVYGCRNHRDGACENGRTIRRQRIEARVFNRLREPLLTPDLADTFTAAIRAERGKMQGSDAGQAL